ncbi:MAG TPA: hypothetical protein VLA36_07235 [Longimicrobiales bacterium]|nr:hypothetical protein [Longimicrobiales bacterium]
MRSPFPPAPALMALLVAAAWTPPPAVAQQERPSCQSCHGELEFLRQHVATLPDAERLYAPAEFLANSAHASMTCADCHTGFRSYPHPDPASTRTCASCHPEASDAWEGGLHALDGGATCQDCHGTHDVLSKAVLESAGGARAVRLACGSCHYEAGAAEVDPHADSVSCAACHAPHGTMPTEDDRSSIHPLNQAATCGACHEDVSAAWSGDAHGAAVAPLALPGGRIPEGASRAEPPTCSACHGSHDMLVPSDPTFGAELTERCAHCHEPYRESWADSYHGQAATLGSPTVATCADCHGTHGIYSSADARSLVSGERLLETCQTCHPQATAGFAQFQPHADHNDKERYPFVYWSYHLMTALLIGVFLVFGAHTFLWLVRLGIDAVRGTPHSAHHDVGG